MWFLGTTLSSPRGATRLCSVCIAMSRVSWRDGLGNEDVGPAVVGGVEGQTGRLLGGGADLPDVDFVVGNIVIMSALGGRPNQPIARSVKRRKVLVRAPAGDVDETGLFE